MNGLTSVFVRLYINLISKDIIKLNITISEECGITNAIYNQAALLMYKFWDQNVLFFFEMFDIILPKDYGTECFVVKNKYFSEEQLNEKKWNTQWLIMSLCNRLKKQFYLEGLSEKLLNIFLIKVLF